MNDLLTEMKRTKVADFLRRHVFGPFWRKRAGPKVTEFKTGRWQSEPGAAYFIKYNAEDASPAVGMMNAVVNSFFLEHCPQHSKVLDVGSGHGIVSIFLARHGHSVTACDISQVLLKELEASGKGLNIEIRHGDAHNIPAKDGEFDVVVARMFLGHFPDWPEVLKEMARCCRPGGKLLIHFTSSENADFGRKFGGLDCAFVDSPDLNSRVPDLDNYFAAASQSQLERACAKAGLRLVERAPNTFFLHNRLIGHSLGQERYDAYQQKALEFFGDGKVREFAVWFEQNVVRHLPVWVSYYNVLVLEKNR